MQASTHQSPDAMRKSESKSRSQNLNDRTDFLLTQIVHEPLAENNLFQKARCDSNCQAKKLQKRRPKQIGANTRKADAQQYEQAHDDCRQHPSEKRPTTGRCEAGIPQKATRAERKVYRHPCALY